MAVDAGSYYTCGVTKAGPGYCWGINRYAQLGDSMSSGPDSCDSEACSRTPRAVAGRLTFSEISTGSFHTCGLTPAGDAYCWGEADLGQLGNGSITGNQVCALSACSTVPVAVPGLSFRSLSLGVFTTCGLATAGNAYCWGDNDEGQLGVGDTTGPQACGGGNTTCSQSPLPVSGGLTFTQLESGANGACGMTSAGAVYCWGENVFGELGDGTDSTRYVPVAVAGGRTFVAITDGDYHHCGLLSSGSGYCWGLNRAGQLGDGTDSNRVIPVAVHGGLGFSMISGGAAHTCGVTTGGATYCWGENLFGQLGDGTIQPSSVPTATHR